jgi:ABC-type multidrug transport system ATPase subunit
MNAIIVKDLVKRFGGFTAVENVNFEVASGQVTAVLGPNGAGKTTTIEILEGFQAPTAGTVRVLDADPRTAGRAWRARIGLVLQTTSLDAQLTVTEALSLFGPRGHRHDGGRQDQDRGAERGPAPPGRPGHRHHRPAGDAVPRRADHRP